jgi:transposase-like protein
LNKSKSKKGKMLVSRLPNIQKCPHCAATNISPRKRLTASGYKTFYCKACKRGFNERTGTEFNDWHFPTDIIFQVLICGIRYKISLGEVAELFLQRGFEFTHETVREWEERFAPLLIKELRLERKRDWRCQIGKNWQVDETYIRVKKQW